MTLHDQARAALARRVLLNRLAAIVAVVAALAALMMFVTSFRPQQRKLRITAGDLLGRRHQLATVLQHEAAERGLTLELVATSGSKQALEMVAAGDLDAALVQGGTDIEKETLRGVTNVLSEPLHLFVKPQLLEAGPAGLRGKRLNLSTPESGTRKVARQTLEFIGLRADADYQDEAHTYSELAGLSQQQLPDGIFAVSSLPWELGGVLVRDHGYRLMELPYGEALALRYRSLHDMVIPAFSYSVVPAVPDRPLHTVATRLLIVAHRDTSEEAIVSLLETLLEGDYARHAELPPLDVRNIEQMQEYPLHAGALRYLHRNEPLVTGEIIESMENLRSFLVSGAIAAFLLWRWSVRRKMIGFETFMDAISEIELEAHELHAAGAWNAEHLAAFRSRISQVKNDALEKHTSGSLKGEEQMHCFLLHLADARNAIEALANRVGGSRRPISAAADGPPE